MIIYDDDDVPVKHHSMIRLPTVYTGVESETVDAGAWRNKQVIAPGTARRYAPADGSSTRGGSTSVRGRACSRHMAKLQVASVPIAGQMRTSGSCAMGQSDR